LENQLIGELHGDAISAVYRLGWINRARILACRAGVGPSILSIYLADDLPNGHKNRHWGG